MSVDEKVQLEVIQMSGRQVLYIYMATSIRISYS